MPLSTKDIHPHVITAECRLPCLRGIVWGPTLVAVGCQLRDDARPHGTLAWLAEWHQQGRLIEIGNVGVKGAAQIGRALEDAGIIPGTPDRQPAAAPQESPEPGSGQSMNDNFRDAPAPDNGRLLRLSEVAEMFRVVPKTVTRWSTEGKLASVRTPGGHRRYPEAGVRALLNPAGNRRAPCPEPARNPGVRARAI
jgi:hypothetical protein